MGVPVKFIKCTLEELREHSPEAKKVDVLCDSNGTLFFIENRSGNTFESIEEFDVIKDGNEFILKKKN